MVKQKTLESRFISDFLFYLYKYNSKILRKSIVKITHKFDGGEFRSLLLRRIFLKYHGLDIGLYSYGCFNPKSFPKGSKIGRYCSFARNCALIAGNHPAKFKSLHPFFYNPDLAVVDELKITRTKFTIDHDVWIGTNALILPRASHIGMGAIIGAGSVVTRSVPPFAIVAGNPAKILKYRFSEEIIEKLIESKWYEQDIENIVRDQDQFMTFIKNLE